uniref:Cationic amino acid transporter C-terminal domain-containing protein n=1 Tax=Salix viminalis TaxID=40686 RepID=A0A6N2N195_SALVM
MGGGSNTHLDHQDGGDHEGMRRRRGCGCSCTKNDFLPEESFQSIGNYLRALKETPMRFKDRLLTRSLDTTELHEIKSRSEHEMKKNLTWWDLIWFGIGAVIGAGIFVLTGLEAKEHAGPAVVLSYAVSGVSAMLSVFCYTEFAVEIPVAGGSFAYLRVELGDFMAFIAAGNIILEYVIGGAAVARSWTSYFATLCNHDPDDFRIVAHSLPEDYGHLDPISVFVCAAICVLAVLSTKGSSRFNYVASIIHIVVILFIIVAGLAKADTKNYSDFSPNGARGIFVASAKKPRNPAKDIPIGLVGSMCITTIAYCLLAVTLTLNVDAPFSVAFETVGWGWAKYIVAAGALKGMTTVLLVSAVGQARYLTHIARTHMMPPCLLFCPTFSPSPRLFIFMLVAVALLVRRYYASGVTTQANRVKLIVCLAAILGSSIATAVIWATADHDSWFGYVITIPIWFCATLALKLLVPQARDPKLWGVPLVPWLPSASILINIFLLGSIDRKSFIRFAAWTGFLLIYYFLFGLHASYDTAKASGENKVEDGLKKVEEGKEEYTRVLTAWEMHIDVALYPSEGFLPRILKFEPKEVEENSSQDLHLPEERHPLQNSFHPAFGGNANKSQRKATKEVLKHVAYVESVPVYLQDGTSWVSKIAGVANHNNIGRLPLAAGKLPVLQKLNSKDCQHMKDILAK